MSILNVDTLRVNTIQSSIGTNALTIETGGRVISPNRPSFQAFNVTQNQTVATNTTIPMTGVIYNNGGHYNTTNSRFIAPVNGTYFFWVSLLISNAAVYGGDGRFWKNGVNSGIAFYANGDATASLRKSVGMAIIDLFPNDYIDIRSAGTNQYWGDAGTAHTQWGGFLL
jgi:F0F1-type ATP synthase membrane subunit a